MYHMRYVIRFAQLFFIIGIAGTGFSQQTHATTFLTDNFTGTASSTLESHLSDNGQGWIKNTASSSSIGLNGGITISSTNDIFPTQTRKTAIYTTTGTSTSADYEIQGTVSVVSARLSDYVGLVARYATSTDNGYAATYAHSAGGFILVKRVNGTPTVLGSYNVTAATNDVVLLRVRGSSISVLVNGIERISASDTTFTDAGKAGVFLYANSAPGDATGIHFDSVTASDLPPLPSVTIMTPSAYQVVQRDGTDTADISISGTYTGTPTALEASWNGASYQTIVSSPTGGTFSGTLLDQPVGQGTLSVRFAGTTTSASVPYVGVGDVFVIAGQSNAVGQGTSNQSYASSTFKAGVYSVGYFWQELTDPVGTNFGQSDAIGNNTLYGGSVWPLLASYIMQNEHMPVAFVPSAKNGSGLTVPGVSGSGQWTIPGNHEDRTTLYGSMVHRARSAGGVKAVLWWQGETDGLSTTTEATYEAALNTLADTIYADLGVTLVPVRLQNSSGISDVAESYVNSAIQAVWAANDHVVAGPWLTDLPSDDAYHLKTDAHLATAASRWWNALDLGVYPASSAYTVTGPDSGLSRTGSTTFTIALSDDVDVPFLGTQTITVSDGGAGGTFSLVGATTTSTGSIRITPEASSTSSTFSYTPVTTGDIELSFTNGQGWNDPDALTYDTSVETRSSGSRGRSGGSVVPSTTSTTNTPAVSTSISFVRDLTLSSMGTDVVALQEFLIARGYSIPAGATGYFGTQTQQALIQFQIASQVAPAQGYFGPKTRAILAASLPVAIVSSTTATVPSPATSESSNRFMRPLSLGSTGDDVIALQTILKEKGFYTYPNITGYYGQATLQAVANFQASIGLDNLGYVGPATRAALNEIPR